MRPILQVGAVALLLALFGVPPVFAAGDPSKVTIGYDPGSSSPVVEVMVDDNTGQARVPMFLGYSGSEPLTGTLLYANLRDKKQTPANVSLQFVDPEQNEAALGRIELSPAMSARQVALRVSGVTNPGILTGFIAIDANGGSTQLATLKVTKSVSSTLKVFEAGDGRDITLGTSGPDLSSGFLVLDTSGQALQHPLSLAASELRSSTGRSISVTLDPASLDKAMLPLTVSVTGKVPEMGDFRGVMVLGFGDQQKVYNLTVKRESAPQQLSLLAISPQSVQRWLPLACLAPSASVTLNLSETLGSPITFYPPGLPKMLRIASLTETVGSSIKWKLQNGKGEIVDPEENGKPRELQLEAYRPSQMTLVLSNFQEVGQYQGTIRVATKGGAEATSAFYLTVKDGCIFPALVILMGVVGSYLLRRWLEIGRPQALGDVAARRAIDRIEAAIRNPDDLIRKALETKLRDMVTDGRLSFNTDISNDIAKIDVLLKNYVTLRKVLDLKAGNSLQRLLPDEAQRENPQRVNVVRQLNSLEDRLNAGSLSSLENDEQGKNALVEAANGIRDTLLKQSQDHVEAAVQKLKADIASNRQSLAGFKEELPRLDALIAQAEEKLKESRDSTGATAIELGAQAYSQYNEAQKAFAQLMTKQFQETLTAQQTAPAGFSDKNPWDTFKAAVEETLRTGNYEEARKHYLTGVLTALQEAAMQQEEALKQLSSQASQHAKGKFEDIAKRADVALKSDVAAQQTMYAEMQADYQALLKAITPRGTALSKDAKSQSAQPAPVPPAGPPGAPIVGDPAAIASAAATGQSYAAIPDLKTIIDRVNRFDVVAVLITGALSVIIGLQILWASNSTFGSWIDYITAFLWGFGLSEINKVALPPLAAKLGLPYYPVTGAGR